MELQEEIEIYIIIVGDSHAPLPFKHPHRKVNKETVYLSSYTQIDHTQSMSLITSRVHILLKHTCNTLQDRLHVRTKNISLTDLRLKLCQASPSDSHRMKLEVNCRRNLINMWKPNDTLLSN
jgi:hypothetical protein